MSFRILLEAGGLEIETLRSLQPFGDDDAGFAFEAGEDHDAGGAIAQGELLPDEFRLDGNVAAFDFDLAGRVLAKEVSQLPFVVGQFGEDSKGRDEARRDHRVPREILLGLIETRQFETFGDRVDQPGPDNCGVGVVEDRSQGGSGRGEVERVAGDRLARGQDGGTIGPFAAECPKPDGGLFGLSR